VNTDSMIQVDANRKIVPETFYLDSEYVYLHVKEKSIGET
jgi:hypothetical protein